MKHIKRISLQDACPKCGSYLELEETTWDSMGGSLVSVLCCKCKVRGENSKSKTQAFEKFEKKLALKEKKEREKPEKILTDIANYLYNQKLQNRWVDFDKALEDLSEYANGLGVEL